MNSEMMVLLFGLISGTVTVLGGIVIQMFSRGKNAAEAQQISAEAQQILSRSFSNAIDQLNTTLANSTAMLEYQQRLTDAREKRIDELERKLLDAELKLETFDAENKKLLKEKDDMIARLEIQLGKICKDKDDEIGQLINQLQVLRDDLNKFVKAGVEKDAEIKELKTAIEKLKTDFDKVKKERDALQLQVTELSQKLENRIAQEQKEQKTIEN